jgi:calcineurin-like phosphoesterase family protein
VKSFFTADLHFGHEAIIRLAKRPFQSIGEMNETLIRQWNETVGPSDVIYCVGDFAWGKHSRFLPQLNGRKYLIAGNHDSGADGSSGWQSIRDMMNLTVDGTKITLCHYAMRVWPGSYYGALHFYGHSHGNMPGDSQSCDVGVDCWDFRPVDLAQIKFFLASQRPRNKEYAA